LNGPSSPGPDLEVLRLRAEALRRIRDFFRARGVLEVETPALSRGISLDCHIDVFSARFHALGHARTPSPGDRDYYLQTSPEPHMKRLLCRGFPDIFQVAKAFRNGERGIRHNPEFTMLEWYRKGFSLAQLMDEVEALCRLLRPGAECVRLEYGQAFRNALGVDPFALDREGLLALPAAKDILPAPEGIPTRADVLDFLMANLIEPGLDPETLTFVTGFPAEQAAQAQVRAGDPRCAERFEVYGAGLELGNGYLELTDAGEYARRFGAENAKRRAHGKPELPVDSDLLADLALGLPPCAGVAMGVDRLVQWALRLPDLGKTLAFPWESA
jgi:elongation factor P--(R)-beta-lysine ligase